MLQFLELEAAPCKHERTYTISDPIVTCEQITIYCCDCFETLDVKIDC